MDVVTDSTRVTLSDELSYNVLALANPKGLSGAHAERVADLALQGCHVIRLLCQTPRRDRGANDDAIMLC